MLNLQVNDELAISLISRIISALKLNIAMDITYTIGRLDLGEIPQKASRST